MANDVAGEIHLDEMAFLGEPDGSEAPVCEVQVSAGGTRVVATRDDSWVVVWERSLAGKAGWSVALWCGVTRARTAECPSRAAEV